MLSDGLHGLSNGQNLLKWIEWLTYNMAIADPENINPHGSSEVLLTTKPKKRDTPLMMAVPGPSRARQPKATYQLLLNIRRALNLRKKEFL